MSRKSVTLVELIIAVSILALIILAINNIDVFSRQNLVSADRRAKLQNDVSFVLDHITKNLSKAIGNELVSGDNSVIDNDTANVLEFFIDHNNNGIRDGVSLTDDRLVKYTLDPNTHQFSFCDYSPISGACAGTSEILARNITGFTVEGIFDASGRLTGNYLTITVSACYNPDGSVACGNKDNPSVTMKTTVIMPSVAAN